MTREIKFRAWSKKHNRYLKITGIQYDGDKIAGVFVVHGIIAGIPNIIFLKAKDVILEQDTGLKDMNGEKICEGDIVKVGSLKPTFKVEYSEPCTKFWTKCKGGLVEEFEDWSEEEIEVIGNIHENQDLLKQNS